MIRKIADSIPYGLGLIAVALGVLALIIANDTRQETRRLLDEVQESVQVVSEGISAEQASLDALVTLDQAERAAEQAESASAAADTVLGLIESGSILLGILLTGGALVFGLNIKDVRERLQDSLKQALDVQAEGEARVNALETRMNTQMAEAKRSDDERLRESQRQFSTMEAQMREQLAQAAHEDELRLKESEEQFQALQQRIETTLASTQASLTDFQDVINDVVQAAQKRAENTFRALSLILLAEQQVRNRNPETAIHTLEEAIPLDPQNQTTNYLLGYLYVGRKRFEEALEHLNRALESNPNFAPALAAKGLAQSRMANQIDDDMKQKQLRAQAEYNLSRALESDPNLLDADDESYFGTLGGVYRRQGRMEDALSAYERAVMVTPNNSYPVGNLAMLYKRLGHEAKALDTFRRVTKLAQTRLENSPGDIWARFDLAQGLLVTGQIEKALDQYHIAFDHISSPGDLEAALSGLRTLKDTPAPPDEIEQAIDLLEAQIARMQKDAVSN